MVLYVCEKCNKEFGRKSNYLTHINKKFSCNKNLAHNIEIAPKSTKKAPKSTEKTEKTENPENTYINSELMCKYCKKVFCRKTVLKKHFDRCKVKKQDENEKDLIFKQLLEKDKQNKIEIDELKNQNKILMDKINKLISLKEHSKSKKTINNKTIINQTNNQTNNIVMVNFGKEDLSIIDKEIFLDRVVKNRLYGVKVPEEILKIIHFNPNYPQLSNIYISDINREKYMIFEDGEWKLSPIDKIPEVIEKVALYSNNLDDHLRTKYPKNKSVINRLDNI